MTEDQINQLVRDGHVIGAIAAIRSGADMSLPDAVSEYHRRAAALAGSEAAESATGSIAG